MATKKKAVKPVAKKPASKKAAPAKPVKKAAPAKKQVKPVPKKATKTVAAKPVAKKSAAKPAKASAKSVKPVAKSAAKKTVVKAAAKVPAKKVSTPVKAKVADSKISGSKNAKPIPTAVTNHVTVHKHVQTPMPKKTEDKKPVNKTVAKPHVSPKAIAANAKDIKVLPAKPVSIPKFATKTARKYQPDFTKSVLDQPKNDPGQPIVRYNDTDLSEFRELIQRKLEAAKKELSYLQGLITRKDAMGGDDSDNRYMTMEDGSLSMEREQLSQMASRQITFIDHLEKAMMRIENKTYGICRITGKLIDKARLRAVPHATLSIEAKMGNVK
ncbi:MAG: TraR/DksA C4-type zinc finger protein [Ferruginibacter sp.]